MLSSLSWRIDLSLSSSRLPVDLWINILNIISLMILLHSAAWVNQETLVEWFSLIISVSILSSNNVCMSVLLSLPRCLVEQLCVCLEPTSDGRLSVPFFQRVVELNLCHWHFHVSVWLRSVVWLQVGLSESGAPLLVQRWMWSKHCCFSVTSEKVGASFVEISLVGHETNRDSRYWFLNLLGTFEPIACFLEIILLNEASSCDLSVRSSKFWVSILAWDKSSVFWNCVWLQWDGFLMENFDQ